MSFLDDIDIDNLNSKDPQFKELYEQLNTYIWSEIKKLEETEKSSNKPKEKQHKKSEKSPEEKTQKEIQTESKITFSMIESKMTFLEQNKDFKQFARADCANG